MEIFAQELLEELEELEGQVRLGERRVDVGALPVLLHHNSRVATECQACMSLGSCSLTDLWASEMLVYWPLAYMLTPRPTACAANCSPTYLQTYLLDWTT